MTAFMLACYMNGTLQGSIYFKSVNDCTFYSKNLSGQTYQTNDGVQVYDCMCKLVPSVDEEKVKVY
tara:strand:- start:242 stop:439 length:198 start_codon:yes stop_codon:yes gene_type:complete